MTRSYSSSMSANEFFGELIPEIANRKAKATEMDAAQLAVNHTIALELQGKDAGQWSFTLNGGEITVSDGIADGANPIAVIQSETWRDAMEGLNEVLGDALEFDRVLELLEQADLSGLDPALLELLEPMTGNTIEVQISDADDTTIGVRFGSTAPTSPTTKIGVDPKVAQQIAGGKVDPASAFMSGQITLEGDMNLAMLMAGFIPQLMKAFKSTGLSL